jgi:NAD(P)-dependent dehydrogenase (short-subunit alcohol dehydrogenase family)
VTPPPPADTLAKYFSLAGKAALVTGASGGIGRALAVGIAGAGAAVALHGRSESQLAETATAVCDVGGSCVTLAADLADPAACAALVDDAAAKLGRLDILVNCAGMNRRKPIESVTDDDYDTIMNVNLRSAYLLSRAAREVMIRHGGGKILHVVSLTSFIGLGGTSVYGMSKAALAQLAKTQAVEWAPDNIQVNCLAPGFIATPLTQGPLFGDEKRRKWILGRIPAKRPGTPDDMVAAVLFMCGPGSAYLTGQTIAVDGGVLAGGSWDD